MSYARLNRRQLAERQLEKADAERIAFLDAAERDRRLETYKREFRELPELIPDDCETRDDLADRILVAVHRLSRLQRIDLLDRLSTIGDAEGLTVENRVAHSLFEWAEPAMSVSEFRSYAAEAMRRNPGIELSTVRYYCIQVLLWLRQYGLSYSEEQIRAMDPLVMEEARKRKAREGDEPKHAVNRDVEPDWKPTEPVNTVSATPNIKVDTTDTSIDSEPDASTAATQKGIQEQAEPQPQNWPESPPEEQSRHRYGPVSGMLSTFAECARMNRRTLKANNGDSYFYIRKIKRTQYEVWLDSQKKYAEWNAVVLKQRQGERH